MNSRSIVTCLMFTAVLLLCLPVVAEDMPKIGTEEAMKHLLESVPAKYPTMAARANIQGKVMVEATVSPEGKVSHVRLVSGHPLLAPAALDAVRQWKFQPFLLNAQPVTVLTTLPVLFNLGPDADLEDKYQKQLYVCAEQLQAGRYNDAGMSCNEALESAKRIPYGFQKIGGYKYAARAAYYLNRYDEAVQLFQERLRLAEANVPPGDDELYYGHSELATAWFHAGKPDQSDVELTAAEKQLAVVQAELDRDRNEFKPEALEKEQSDLNAKLREDLQYHAKVLRQLGRNSEADEMEKKAAGLK